MPSRVVTVLILLFWAASSGWFFYTEFWPWLRGGEAPPFVIDLADEARRNSPPINWDVIHNGKVIGRLATTINYREADDSFALNGRVTDLVLSNGNFEVPLMTNTYRVTRDGKLLAIHAEADVKLGPIRGQVMVDGVLRGREFVTTLRAICDVLKLNKEITLPPVAMSERGSALNPLHPVDRIRGLKPGRAWRITLVDPIGDGLRSLRGGGVSGPTYLLAQVLPRVDRLEWGGKERDCHVIRYKGDGFEAQTWVLVSDGSVIRQQANYLGEDLVLERTSP
jgi:hypothetical protein